MRFFKNGREICFEEFALALPEESQVLGPLVSEKLSQETGGKTEWEIDQSGTLFLKSEFSGPIRILPVKDLAYHKSFFHKHSPYSQPLAKALGVKKGRPRPTVFDATAGTLKDSLLIVALGCQVVASDRSPVAQALIINALKFFPVQGLEFLPIDAKEALKTREDFDVLYYDPMYELKNEKAAPRKEMRIFRDLVGQDRDAKESAQIFFEFIKDQKKRLVIKRSSKSRPLLKAPAISFGQKSTLYDVYL